MPIKWSGVEKAQNINPRWLSPRALWLTQNSHEQMAGFLWKPEIEKDHRKKKTNKRDPFLFYIQADF